MKPVKPPHFEKTESGHKMYIQCGDCLTVGYELIRDDDVMMMAQKRCNKCNARGRFLFADKDTPLTAEQKGYRLID